MFSTSTTASSTSSPMAIARPPKVMVLMERPAKLKHHGGGEDGNRNRRQRNDRGAPVEQEGEQNDGHDQGRFDQHALNVVDRGFDEIRLAEKDLVGLDP